MRVSLLVRSFCLGLVVATAVMDAPVRAQNAPTVEPGTRIRVTHHAGNRVVGSVVTLAGDTLRVRPAGISDTLAVLVSEVTQWEMSEGPQRHVLRNMAYGFGLGAGAGAIGGVIHGDDPPGAFIPLTAPQYAAIFGVFYGITGAIVGAATGLHATEEWTRLPLPSGSHVSIAPRGDGRVAVGLSLRF